MTSTRTRSAGLLVARLLLSFIFILSGFGKLGDIAGNMAYVESGGLPGFFLYPAIALEIGAGIAVLVGWQTALASLALAAFTVLAGILYHYIPAQSLDGFEAMMQIISFNKNLAIAGGLVALAVAGPGAWSVEARQERGRVAPA
jgi:putative oxidoreductase